MSHKKENQHIAQTNTMIDTALNDANTRGNALQDQAQRLTDAANLRQQTAYNDIYAGFGNLGNNGGLSDDQFAKLQGGFDPSETNRVLGKAERGFSNLVAGKGINKKALLSSVPTYKELMKTGGFTDEDRAVMNKSIGGLLSIGTSGGISEADQYRARGLGVYDEFSKTGGISDEDARNIRARGDSVVPSFYGALKNELARRNVVQGGYNPGYGVQAANLSREQAKSAQEATLNTELGLKSTINTGRLAGAAGASSTEIALQELLSRNKLAGLAGAGQLQSSMSEAIAQIRIAAANGNTAAQGQLQSLLLQSRIAGNQGLLGVAAGHTQVEQLDAQNQQFIANFLQTGKIKGLEGQFNLRGQTPGELSMALDNQTSLYNARNNANIGLLGTRTNNTPGGGGFPWSSVIGAGGAIVGGLLGGGGGGKGKTKVGPGDAAGPSGASGNPDATQERKRPG